MFTQLKNIDTAFRYTRMISLAVVAASVLISILAIIKSQQAISQSQQRIYILANGKALEAFAADRKDNVPVEARDHIRQFHQLFFTLDPDEKVIQTNINKSLYLADGSAKKIYDNLRESRYLSGIISANMSQRITVDSIVLNLDETPYRFRCHATQSITRSTSVVTRSLITEGFLRNVSRSDNNPHGFLIERWITIENRDISTKDR